MLKLFFGIMFGAGLMYLFDPNRGPERRQALSAKFRRDSREHIVEAGKETVTEAKERAQTVASHARDRFDQTVEHARDGALETVTEIKEQTRGIAESAHERADSVFANDNKRS